MRSNTLVFSALVLAVPSLAWWTSEATPPCESETKTLSLGLPHPSETVAPTFTHPTVPTYPISKPKPPPTYTHTHSPKPTSSAEGYPPSLVSTSASEAPTETPVPNSYPQGPSLSLPPTKAGSTLVVPTTEGTAPKLETSALSAPVGGATSAAEGGSTYAPPAIGYSNGTVANSQSPSSPSAAPTSKPSGIVVPISGASMAVGGWGVGSVVLVVGVVLAIL